LPSPKDAAILRSVLFLLFILVPALELWLLVEIGSRVGVPFTILLIVLTGALGAFLVRLQGIGVMTKIQPDLGAGQLPTSHLLDGILILLAGAFLLTPGVVTDVLGFSLLTPPVRSGLRRVLLHHLKGRVGIAMPNTPPSQHEQPPPGTIDVEAREG